MTLIEVEIGVSSGLEEAQQRDLSRIRRLDWAGRNPEEIAGAAFPRR